MPSDFVIHGGCTTADSTWVLLMRGTTQFDITADHRRIEGTKFEAEYRPVLKEYKEREQKDPRSCLKPLDFVGQHCLPTLKELVPNPCVEGPAVQEFFHSPFYKLEIVPTKQTGGWQIAGTDSCTYKPALNLVPLHVDTLLDDCRSVPRFHANEITVNTDNNDSISTLQGKVTIPSGEGLYFKPREAAREKHFDRELDILQRIQDLQLTKSHAKLPALKGIVTAGDNNDLCVGLLIEVIVPAAFGSDLLSPGCWTQHHLHDKWEHQVRATMSELHAHNIFWGDVNAGNVFIDRSNDAWIIDFGGMNNPEFVDDDKAETMDGDWQGIERLFREWLPKRRIECESQRHS